MRAQALVNVTVCLEAPESQHSSELRTLATVTLY